MNYVIVGYLITFVTFAIYSLLLLRRGRELSKQLPEDDRRFLG